MSAGLVAAATAGIAVAATPPPSVSGLSPDVGLPGGGATVSVYGQNLAGTTSVVFGSTTATVVSVADSKVVVTAPAHAAGQVDVRVTTSNGTSAVSGGDVFTYSATPVVDGVYPSEGGLAGGETVTVYGQLLSAATKVLFGTVAGTDLTVASDTQLSITAPASSTNGTVDLTVVSPGGRSVITLGDEYTYSGVPEVQGLSPNSGPTAGGGTVTIYGDQLAGATSVTFGGTPGTALAPSSNGLTVKAPAHPAGTVDVVVTTPTGVSPLSGSDRYTYSDVPQVISLSTSNGPTAGGTLVKITGANFTGVNLVKVGDTAATVVAKSATSVSILTPAATRPGGYDVTVRTPAGTSAVTGADVFTYSDVPTVGCYESGFGCGLYYDSIGPTSGGVEVTIYGRNLDSATAVLFGSVGASSFTVVSSNQLRAVTPAVDSEQTVDVRVVTPAGTSDVSRYDLFTYTDQPMFGYLSADSGPVAGGQQITIGGSQILDATSVQFGAVSAPIVSRSGDAGSYQYLDVTVPAARTPGTVRVTVTTPHGTSQPNDYGEDIYTYGPVPSVSQLSDGTGGTNGGSSITVYGTNLSGATTVLFGTTSVRATNASDDSVTARVPAHVAGTVDVRVKTASGTTAISRYDVYTFSDVPVVYDVQDSASPTSGGGTVTLSGANLGKATGVVFGDVAGTIRQKSATSVTATVPAHAAGSVHVRVVSPAGSSPVTSGDLLTYTDQPYVTFVSPAVGSTAGGVGVYVQGVNLQDATGVLFGNRPATSVSSSSSYVSATVPAGVNGTVHVTVVTPHGTSTAGDSDTYTYTDQPMLTGASDDSGPTAGGATMTLYGLNLTGATAVHFGDTDASTFTVSSDQSVDVVVPSHPAGPVRITVTTPTGTSAIATNATYTYDDVPSVTGLSPSYGPVSGGTVQIYGANFTGVTSVSFGTKSARITQRSGSSLTVRAPAVTAATTVNVRVTTAAGGTSDISARAKYSYSSSPSVTYVSPDTGPVGGGTSVQIYGSNFTGASAVRFGAVDATSFTVNGANSIVAVAPAGTDTVHVTVATRYGTSAIGPYDLFTYGTAKVAVVDTSLRSGPTSGGALVHIFGTRLDGVTSVRFGTVLAAAVVRVAPTEIVVVAPPHAAGTVAITLQKGLTRVDGTPGFRFR